jgi:hypothetical protein
VGLEFHFEIGDESAIGIGVGRGEKNTGRRANSWRHAGVDEKTEFLCCFVKDVTELLTVKCVRDLDTALPPAHRLERCIKLLSQFGLRPHPFVTGTFQPLIWDDLFYGHCVLTLHERAITLNAVHKYKEYER